MTDTNPQQAAAEQLAILRRKMAAAATDRAALRDRIAEAVRRQAETGNVRYEAIADAVLAELLGPIPPDADVPTWTAIRAIQLMNEAGRQRDEQRLALSQALGLGTGAPWDAIRDRAAELAAASAPVSPAPADGSVRGQLLDALDFAYCQGLGYGTPDELLAAYDASRASTGPAAPDLTAEEQVDRLAQWLWDNCAEDERSGLLADDPRRIALVALRWPELHPVADAATAEHHTVDGVRHLCHADDHYCPPASGPGGVAGETQQDEARCGCPHPEGEHSIYGCVDGCACEWMPKRPPMDPVHILGIYADEQPAAVSQPAPAVLTPCTCRQAIHKREHGTRVAGCPWCTAAADAAEQAAAVSQPDGEAATACSARPCNPAVPPTAATPSAATEEPR
ncbi:hypothetical protein [Streptomyces sp. NPDC051997]|uniref:hypothetical protein n=1 Tax=Streptomyces sp. NPDC051997 TaxID=3155611 RepID=UPI003426E4E0